MASNITVDTLTKGSTTLNTDEIVDTNSNQICKAWVNFNGEGTVAIRDSYNVSSVTDNGTGDFGVNFTSSMSNADYSITGSAHRPGGDNNAGMCVHGGSNPTTSSVRIAGRYPTTSNAKDYAGMFVQVFGD